MQEELKKFLGDGPYPYAPEKLDEFIDIRFNEKMVVLNPKISTDLDKGFHSHKSYEFIIPSVPMPFSKVDNRKTVIEANKMFPLNSEQEHGSAVPIKMCKILAFQFEENFVREMTYSIYKREEVVFQNESYPLDQSMLALLNQFIEESDNRQAGYQFVLDCISTQLVVKLLRILKTNFSTTVSECANPKLENINRVIEFFMEHYDLDYSLKLVAQVANLSPYHFIRVFKAQTGKTPYEYLMDIKINKAREMLKNDKQRLSITQICYSCGFNSLNHFSGVFKRKVGVSPSVYRKLL